MVNRKNKKTYVFDHPNYGDDLSRQCPDCGRFEESWDTIEKHGMSGILIKVCPCGWEDWDES
jgi:hypothetical protein